MARSEHGLSVPTSTSIITLVREVFSRNSVPGILVSDNPKVFVHNNLNEFCFRNGMRPIDRFYLPMTIGTNGQSKRYVHMLKQKHLALNHEKDTYTWP